MLFRGKIQVLEAWHMKNLRGKRRSTKKLCNMKNVSVMYLSKKKLLRQWLYKVRTKTVDKRKFAIQSAFLSTKLMSIWIKRMYKTWGNIHWLMIILIDHTCTFFIWLYIPFENILNSAHYSVKFLLICLLLSGRYGVTSDHMLF